MKKLFFFCLLCLIMAFGFAPRAQAQDDCVISSLPFTEGFENATGALPDCFSRNPLGVANTGYHYPEVTSYSQYVHTGNKALRAFQILQPETSATVYTLIFPQLGDDFEMANMVLEFWARSNQGINPFMVIGVLDDPEDLSTFTSVETVQNTVQDSYQKFTVYFDQYEGEGRYITIKFANTPAFGDIVLDDIVLDEAALCSPVQYLTLQNVAGTDVTISWQPNTLGGTNAYNVTLLNLTDGTQDLVTTTNDTFYVFNNLDYATNYRAYVSVTCSDNQVSSADSVDFSTLVEPVPVPYVETFEGDVEDILSHITFSGEGPHQWAYGSATCMNEPGHALYISADSGATNSYNYHVASTSYAIFNAVFPEGEAEYHLSFDYKVKGRKVEGGAAFDFLSVYMVDSDAEPTYEWDGTPEGTALLLEAANKTEWTHHDVILQNVAGTGKQFILFWKNWGTIDDLGDLNPPAAIDNLSISVVACQQPSGLAATNVTGESALVSWIENGNATDWVVYYRPMNSTEDYNEVQVSNVSSIELDNLIANTQYDFYVIADCGTSVSYPSEHASFRTSCGQIDSLPYFEDFESGLYTTDQATYIACWNRTSSDNSHYVYVNNQFWDAYSGEHYLSFQNTTGCHIVAILPELGENLNAHDLMVSFQVSHTYFGFGWDNLGTLEVGVMTDPEDDSSFVSVANVDISSVEYYTYVAQLVSLVGYDGEGKYIAFRVSNCDNCGYYIDDVELLLRPSCMHPDNFVAQQVTNESVTLSWDELGEATSWNIQYGPTGFMPSDDAESLIADNTTFTVTGLNNLTGYDFYVQAECGGDWTGPLSITTGVLTMGNTGSDTIVTCEGIICDDGGINGYYSTYCDYSVTVYPAEEGSGVQIFGTADLHPGYIGYDVSYLRFYEGTSAEGTLLAEYSGYDQYVTVASTGPITVIFTSGYYTAAGFALNVTCGNCMPPTNVTVSDITTETATVSWEGTADQYSVTVSGDLNGYYTTSSNSLTINGLSSNGSYTVQVRSLCEADSSLPTIPVSFSTPCDPFTITVDAPWTEDFEGYEGSGERPFQCWERPVVDYLYNAPYGAPFVYCGWAQSCHSGYNSVEFKGGTGMLLLPPFTNDLHELQISFWATSTDPSSGSLEIGVLTDSNDPGSFELIGISSAPGPRGETEGVAGNGNLIGPFTFANASATSGRIALRYANPSNSSQSWNLDDFVVELIPDTTPIIIVTDPTVATAAASEIGQTTAKLNATVTNPDNVTITAKGFKWMPLMGEDYTTIAATVSTDAEFSAVLNDLTPNTDYIFHAFIVFNGDTVSGNDLIFNTEEEVVIEPCDVPTGLHVVENGIHNESIEVAWDANDNAEKWNLRHRPVNGEWTTVTALNENSYTINGLVGLTTYEIEVQADCGDNNVSDWSGFISVQTTNVGIVNFLDNSVTLFPNPAREYVDVHIDGDLNVTAMEVYDVYGKLINTVNVVENPTRINVSGLANGMYFVRVSTDNGAVTKTFVKK